jgi:hypothetical protein
VVDSPHRKKLHTFRNHTTFHAMKTNKDASLLENLNLVAAVSCICSVLYFVASNLLA